MFSVMLNAKPNYATIALNIVLLLVLHISVLAQSSIKVLQGQQLKLSNARVICSELVMEDGSSLILNDGMRSLYLEAESAKIGKGCKIIASGKVGPAGRNGEEYTDRAGACNAGAVGRRGGAGGNGLDGANITLKMDFMELGNLDIITSGGNGGAGGKGGNGQRGGPKEYGPLGTIKCGGGSGGHGGEGGRGGNGGKGGNVSVLICQDTEFDVKTKIKIRNQGGAPGIGGSGGNGGAGGGDKSAGPPGRNGTHGVRGPDGGPAKFESIYCGCMESQGGAENIALIIWTIDDSKADERVWEKYTLEMKENLNRFYHFSSILEVKNPDAQKLQNVLGQNLKRGGNTNLFVYITGHGVGPETSGNGQYSYLAANGQFVPFSSIGGAITTANVKNLLFVFDVCYSGKIFDNFSNITLDQPQKSTIRIPEIVCGKSGGRTIISGGYDVQKVSTELSRNINHTLKTNHRKSYCSDEFFMDLFLTGGPSFARKPIFAKFKGNQQGDFIFFKK